MHACLCILRTVHTQGISHSLSLVRQVCACKCGIYQQAIRKRRQPGLLSYIQQFHLFGQVRLVGGSYLHVSPIRRKHLVNNLSGLTAQAALFVSPLGAIWQFPVPLATQVCLGCLSQASLKKSSGEQQCPGHLPSSHGPSSAWPAALAPVPQGAVGFPVHSEDSSPAKVPFANDVSLEIPLPSTERRVSPAGWGSWQLSFRLYIPHSGSQSLVRRFTEAALGRSEGIL